MNSPGRRDRRTDTETLFSQLTVVKTDRTLLASLFIEVAKCLNQNGNGGPARSLHNPARASISRRVGVGALSQYAFSSPVKPHLLSIPPLARSTAVLLLFRQF